MPNKNIKLGSYALMIDGSLTEQNRITTIVALVTYNNIR